MNSNAQNIPAPFKVFETEEEWDNEVKKIIGSCISYMNRNAQAQGAPQPQTAQTNPAAQTQAPDAEQTLRAEIEQMQKEVPGFDFKKLMATNEAFKNYIMHGYSVKEAYSMSVNEPEKNKKKRLGIRENGITAGRSGASVNDAMSMNDQDFKTYIKSIMGGNL